MNEVVERILEEVDEGMSPEEILERVLTESDQEALHNIKHELGLCIKWGPLVERFLETHLDGMDTLVFMETEKGEPAVVKRNPYEALFASDQSRINSSNDKSQLCQRYVLLHLLKKLLGALKTRVNQEINAIETIDDETEMELKALLAEGPDEEEMGLVDRKKTKKDEHEIIAQVDVGEERGCEHNRSTIRQVRAGTSKSGLDEMHSYCKDCRQVIRVEVLGTKTTKKESWFSRSRQCLHREVHWREGQEGQVAECAYCEQLVPNPGKYQWSKVGLEPFGDNPEDDEIMAFPTGQKEAAA